MSKNILLSIGVLLAIALITLVIWQIKKEKEVGKIWRSLETLSTGEVFTEEMITMLPEPAKRYFLHAIALGTPLATSVRLEMRGSIRLGEDKPWLPMQATEIISRKGFVWKAKVGRLLPMVGADYYANREGRMGFSLWGLLPLVDAHSPDITRSSIGRLGGEWIWLPFALARSLCAGSRRRVARLPQQNVSWQAIDENTVQASLKIDGEPVTLTLVIDPDGKLLKFSLPRWGNQTEDSSYTYIPFGGEVQAEQNFSGLTIPSQISAGWWFGTERYLESFRATIEQAELG